MKVPVEKQIEIYDHLNARHTVTAKGVDKLSWEEILEIGNIIKNKIIMKELSIKKKAKRYDEAIERAKEMIKDMTNIGGVAKVDDIQYLFPELKESKDERIRKVLVGWIKCEPLSSFEKGFSQEQILAWLEKQGEQKPIVVPKFREGDRIIEKSFDECGCVTIKEIKDGKYIFDDGSFVNIEEQNLWQLVEQKPVYKVEPKFHEGDWITIKE